jgi:hypothetical protein
MNRFAPPTQEELTQQYLTVQQIFAQSQIAYSAGDAAGYLVATEQFQTAHAILRAMAERILGAPVN